MKKEIKKLIEEKLFNNTNNEEWAQLIETYTKSIRGTAKGIVLKCRYKDHKNYWKCLNELKEIRVYFEKDYFYRLVNEIISDIAMIASYERILNPYEF